MCQLHGYGINSLLKHVFGGGYVSIQRHALECLCKCSREVNFGEGELGGLPGWGAVCGSPGGTVCSPRNTRGQEMRIEKEL